MTTACPRSPLPGTEEGLSQPFLLGLAGLSPGKWLPTGQVGRPASRCPSPPLGSSDISPCRPHSLQLCHPHPRVPLRPAVWGQQGSGPSPGYRRPIRMRLHHPACLGGLGNIHPGSLRAVSHPHKRAGGRVLPPQFLDSAVGQSGPPPGRTRPSVNCRSSVGRSLCQALSVPRATFGTACTWVCGAHAGLHPPSQQSRTEASASP